MKLFSVPENIVWENVHIKDLTQSLKKFFLNGLVVLMFVFLTTPAVGCPDPRQASSFCCTTK